VSRRARAYVAFCSECHRYFGMAPIKSDYKMCPSCGRRVKWTGLKKKPVGSRGEAVRIASELNGRLAKGEGGTLREVLRREAGDG
jgi:DNA-directed RNA polymerase subunit RPC12/RpoP